MPMNTMLGRALRSIRPGVDALTSSRIAAPRTITVRSPSFRESEDIPTEFTAEGAARFPGVSWSGVPEGAAELVLLVEDADIPLPVAATHLIVYGINPASSEITVGAIGGFQPGRDRSGWSCGRNFLGARGWTPPAPPPGHGPHRYAFQLFALSEAVPFRFPPRRGHLLRRIQPHIVAQGRLIGTFGSD